jgi:carbon-monoxide dehydrogenase medium subunit
MAGGLSLVTEMKLHQTPPCLLVDLRQIKDLRGVRGTAADGSCQIGAMTTYAEMAACDEIKENYGVLAEAVSSIGDAQVRNRGTIGGNIAYNSPAADLPAAVLALGATISTVGPNKTRTIPGDEFFVGPFRTALEDGEIITSVGLAADQAGSGSAYEKFSNLTNGYAICGVAALVGADADGTVNRCRVAVTGVAERAVRLRRVETQLEGKGPTRENIAAAARQVSQEGLTYLSDFYASGEYRAHLAEVLIDRAVTRASGLARQSL